MWAVVAVVAVEAAVQERFPQMVGGKGEGEVEERPCSLPWRQRLPATLPGSSTW